MEHDRCQAEILTMHENDGSWNRLARNAKPGSDDNAKPKPIDANRTLRVHGKIPRSAIAF